MPAAHWSLVPLAVAAALGLSRRRAVGHDGAVESVVATRRLTTEEFLSLPATPTVVFQHAMAGCSDREIADRFGLAEADVRAAYAPELAAARAQRAFALRRAQTELATGVTAGGGKPAGNGPMLMWLGRNELGQSLSPAARGEPEPELTDD